MFTRLVTEPQRAPATKVTQSRTRVLNAQCPSSAGEHVGDRAAVAVEQVEVGA